MASRSIALSAARGGVAGLAGTALMSLVMEVGRRIGAMVIPPPEQITESAEAKSGVGDDLSQEAFTASWLALHAGYGAASGALFSLVRPTLPASPAVAGLLYGGLVWAASYLGLMPALRLYPWPREDSPSRQVIMIVAHAVYGVVTSLADRSLAERERQPGAPLDTRPGATATWR